MNKFALLIPAALVAFASPAQATNPASPQTPKLSAQGAKGRIMWAAQNAYYVTVTPGSYGERLPNGSLAVPPGTYCVRAVGAMNRATCKDVVVR